MIKNVVFCEMTGVLTKCWMDSNDVEHFQDFEYIDSAIENLKKLIEETNSLLIVVKLERWATTDLYNKTRISALQKRGLRIDDYLDVSLEWKYSHLGPVAYDTGVISLTKQYIKEKGLDVDKTVYIRRGDFFNEFKISDIGIYKISEFSEHGLTKKCSKSIKKYLS